MTEPDPPLPVHWDDDLPALARRSEAARRRAEAVQARANSDTRRLQWLSQQIDDLLTRQEKP